LGAGGLISRQRRQGIQAVQLLLVCLAHAGDIECIQILPSPYATTAHASLSPYADWAQALIDAGVTMLDVPVIPLTQTCMSLFVISAMAASMRSSLSS